MLGTHGSYQVGCWVWCILGVYIHWYSDNVARKFRISRTAQDDYSVQSHRRAQRAQEMGLFIPEIVPVDGVRQDDGIRGDCTPESLQKLPPAFKPKSTPGGSGGGEGTWEYTTTAGNSSQVSAGVPPA